MAVYRVLALDGGGIRGVLTATLLSRLEQLCPGFMASVDLVAGTSTGGILALGLAAGLSPAQMAEMYEKSGPKIFANSFLNELRDLDKLIGADYDTRELRQALLETVGDITLADLKKRVLVSSFDLDNQRQPPAPRTWKPKFFHNYPGPDSDGKERLIDVALRTSAAPTYFPIYQGYIDGGVVANNPSMCALAEALNVNGAHQPLKKIVLLSVGTGAVPKYLPQLDSDWGLVQWAPHLISLMLDGGAGLADYQCREVLGLRYRRLNPLLPYDIGLDAVKEIPILKQLAGKEDLSDLAKWIQEVWGLKPPRQPGFSKVVKG